MRNIIALAAGAAWLGITAFLAYLVIPAIHLPSFLDYLVVLIILSSGGFVSGFLCTKRGWLLGAFPGTIVCAVNFSYMSTHMQHLLRDSPMPDSIWDAFPWLIWEFAGIIAITALAGVLGEVARNRRKSILATEP